MFEPLHATPTMRTLPAYFLLASSTEGASKLHVLQPGAQNQKATGNSAIASCRENELPSPMMRAVTSGLLTLVSTGAALDDGTTSDVDAPHAPSTTTADAVTAKAEKRRMTRV